MDNDQLLKEFRKQCTRDLAEIKEKFPSQEFVKGVQRGLAGAELILRQLLREMEGEIIEQIVKERKVQMKK
jgi:hypothetical protein